MGSRKVDIRIEGLIPQKKNKAVSVFGREYLPHPTYSPELVPLIYSYLVLLRYFCVSLFSSDNEVKSIVSKGQKNLPKTFYTEGIQKFVFR